MKKWEPRKIPNDFPEIVQIQENRVLNTTNKGLIMYAE